MLLASRAVLLASCAVLLMIFRAVIFDGLIIVGGKALGGAAAGGVGGRLRHAGAVVTLIARHIGEARGDGGLTDGKGAKDNKGTK